MNLNDQLDHELALFRGSLCIAAGLTAAALTAPPGRRAWHRGRLRRAVIAGAAMAALALACAGGAAAAAFHSPSRALTGIAVHHHCHGRPGRRHAQP